MSFASAPQVNHLIANLPEEVRQRWLPRLEPVELKSGAALHESGCQMGAAYFPTTAVVSLVYETAEGASMELAMVGNEGIVGVELLLGGGSTPGRAVVRTPGAALRLPGGILRDEFDAAGAASPLLLRYIMALSTQVAQTAVCARHHSLEQRLCGWLLTRLDRVQGNALVATHEQIASMLGVRREGVTEGALHLQRLGLIRYSRGLVAVQDRPGLEAQVCECYAAVKKEFQRLLPAMAAAPAWSAARGPSRANVPDGAQPGSPVPARALVPSRPSDAPPGATTATGGRAPAATLAAEVSVA